MALVSTVYAGIRGTLLTVTDVGIAQHALTLSPLLARLGNGTDSGEADLVFADTRTLASGAVEDLDLAGGLTDPLGNTLNFARVKAILVRADADNIDDVIVGGGVSDGFQGPFGAADNTVAVPPGGALLLAAPQDGWPVTAGTGELLQIASEGDASPPSSVTYDIVIVGASA